MKITSLILSSQESFMKVEVLTKKDTIYAKYYSDIISVIYNILISVTKTNHYMTFMVEV